MKLIQTLSAMACAVALLAGTALAADKTTPRASNAATTTLPTKTCCEKAKAEGKRCTMKCCMAAHKEGKSCEVCNKNKEDLKKDASPAGTKADAKAVKKTAKTADKAADPKADKVIR